MNGAISASTTHQSSRPHHKLILVVDDSPTVRNILETCLSQEGFLVHTFSDGIEMMRWLTGPEGCVPDLVILDINLPKIDGYEVARRLKAKPHFAHSIILHATHDATA